MEQLLDAAGVPYAPVQNVEQVLAHEQTQALGMLQQVPAADRPDRTAAVARRRAPAVRLASPALGAQTAEILGGDAKGETDSDTKTPQKA